MQLEQSSTAPAALLNFSSSSPVCLRNTWKSYFSFFASLLEQRTITAWLFGQRLCENYSESHLPKLPTERLRWPTCHTSAARTSCDEIQRFAHICSFCILFISHPVFTKQRHGTTTTIKVLQCSGRWNFLCATMYIHIEIHTYIYTYIYIWTKHFAVFFF